MYNIQIRSHEYSRRNRNLLLPDRPRTALNQRHLAPKLHNLLPDVINDSSNNMFKRGIFFIKEEK